MHEQPETTTDPTGTDTDTDTGTDTGTGTGTGTDTDTTVPPTMTLVEDLEHRATVQAHSIVSTTVLRAQGARVVLFAFDTGQELSEHTAAVPVLVQTLHGRVRVTASGREVELLPGHLVHLPARTPHAVHATEPAHVLLTLLDPRG